MKKYTIKFSAHGAQFHLMNRNFNYQYSLEDAEKLVKDLLNELLQENEVGETLVTDMLDSAAVRAIEQGSEFIIPISEEERMERIK